jgi:hypothetical protein
MGMARSLPLVRRARVWGKKDEPLILTFPHKEGRNAYCTLVYDVS